MCAQYIAASYVKWIESAGGRVVPIPYNGTNEEMDKIFEHINGLLLPGGGAAVSTAAAYIVNKAIDAVCLTALLCVSCRLCCVCAHGRVGVRAGCVCLHASSKVLCAREASHGRVGVRARHVCVRVRMRAIMSGVHRKLHQLAPASPLRLRARCVPFGRRRAICIECTLFPSLKHAVHSVPISNTPVRS